MGEAARRLSKKKLRLLPQGSCVYCNKPLCQDDVFEEDHMPPRAIFNEDVPGYGRPDDWWFLSCEPCNKGTRGADALASLFAMTSHVSTEKWKVDRISKLMAPIKKYARDAYDDLQRSIRLKNLETYLLPPWRQPSDHAPVQLTANGVGIKRNLDLFSAKLALATFSQLTSGRRLGDNHVILTTWYLNGGLDQEGYDHITSVMPMFAQLEQGKKVSTNSFSIRYNSDKTTSAVATASFHDNLFIAVAASDNPGVVAIIKEQYQSRIEAAPDRHRTLNITTQRLHPMLPQQTQSDQRAPP